MDRAAAPPALARLSAPYTFIYKYVFPPVWLVMMGIVVARFWIEPDTFSDYPYEALPAPFEWLFSTPLMRWLSDPAKAKWVFTGLYCVGVLLMWMSFGLKRVDLTADGLIVSNYRIADTIAFHDIAEVRELKWLQPRSILLVLRTPCRFGTRVRFLAQQQRGLRSGDHPTATMLRARAGL